MARRLGIVVLLAAAASAEDAAGRQESELAARFAELERMMQSQQRMIESQAGLIETQQGRILNLETRPAAPSVSTAAPSRRLTHPITAPLKSIHASADPGATAVTVQYSVLERAEMNLTHVWLLLCGALVVAMQAGFAMVKVGSCRAVSAQSILLCSLLDVCLGTLGWWISGWALAFSGPMERIDGVEYKQNRVMGYEQFAGHAFLGPPRSDGQQEPTMDIVHWFFQWACCIVAVTIASGGSCERVDIRGQAIYSFLFAAGIYPIMVACSKGMGWLTIEVNTVGYTDFGGSGLIHLAGGVGSFIGSFAIGPRKGRFDRPKEFSPHNVPLIALGTFLLWFGWYGLNCGNTMGMDRVDSGFLAAQVAMNTTLAAASGGLVAFLLRSIGFRKYDVAGFCNGILAGLVAISAGCANVDCGYAVIIGIGGAVMYVASSWLMRHVQVDDPCDTFSVHGAAGAWGVLAAAIFDWGALGSGYSQYHGRQGFACVWNKSLLACQVDIGGKAMYANIWELGMVFIWVGLTSVTILVPLRLIGLLKASEDKHWLGQDEFLHRPRKAYEIEPFISSKPLFRSTLQAI